MKYNPEKISKLIEEIDAQVARLKEKEAKHKALLSQASEPYKKSARNLLHYLVFRQMDLRFVQKKLGHLGLSRLAKAEGHVLASLLFSRHILGRLIHEKNQKFRKSGLSIKSGEKLLVNHTKELLGYRSKGRRVRIMVTQPTEAAYNYSLVHDMVKSGMNCARINCAHDGPEVWSKIIKNIKKASAAMGREIKITMDLAGPKIRTGAIKAGPKVRKFNPERDELGRVMNPASILFVPEVNEESERHCIPVPRKWMAQLKVGDRIRVSDMRDKQRAMKVIDISPEGVLVNCYETSYLGTGTTLKPEREGVSKATIGEMPPLEQFLLLRVNDRLTIHKEGILGEPAIFDEDGQVLQQAHVSCQLAEVFEHVKVGERILFDDGKIEGIIDTVGPEQFEVLITRARENGSKLKAEKGINFPTTDLHISGLTKKDKEDLKFVAAHADVVNFSFVSRKEDVEELYDELEKLGVLNKLNVILKIETRRAYNNLAQILFTAMRSHYVGVMIARGDLAVETGWDSIGRVQRELVLLCSAAHIPVIWATQVLENLAKKGLPSRSEITDTTSAVKSECVMLNKGPYITEAIRLLDTILSDMESLQEKNAPMLPQLKKLAL